MAQIISKLKLQAIDYSGVGIISLAHVLNDMYSNYLPALIPFLAISLGVTATKAAILVSVFSLTSYFVSLSLAISWTNKESAGLFISVLSGWQFFYL